MALPDLISGATWQQAQIAYQRGDLSRCELEASAALRLAQHDLSRAIEDLGTVLERNAAWGQRRVEPPLQPLFIEALTLAGQTIAAEDHCACLFCGGT